MVIGTLKRVGDGTEVMCKKENNCSFYSSSLQS